MITENDLYFSDGQAETTVATHASTNDIDLLSTYGDAIPHALWLIIAVQTALASAGAATIQYQLQTGAANGGEETLWTGPAVAYTTQTAGKVTAIKVPLNVKRYLRVNYIIGTAVLTGGAWQALLSTQVEKTHPTA
jgi:hypothetical protein